MQMLKSVDHPKDHKVIGVWLIMLFYANGCALQKTVEKILKSKILQECIREMLFGQCIHGNTELVKVSSSLYCNDCTDAAYVIHANLSLNATWFNLNQEHFMSFLSVSDYLLACKEDKAREFAPFLFTALFEEFTQARGIPTLLVVMIHG